MALQTDSQNIDYHRGYLDCLLHLGRLSESVTYVQGLLSQPRYARWSCVMGAYGVQAAWRMRQWEQVDSYLAAGDLQRTFQGAGGRSAVSATQA